VCTDFKALLNDPMRELDRICEFVAIESSEEVTRRCALCASQLAVSDGDSGPEVPAELKESAAADRRARRALP
jgi:hypothetical protein